MRTASKMVLHHYPERWRDGLVVGCGEFGAMVWGDGKKLNFTLDHLNTWEMQVDESFLDAPEYNYASLRKLVAEKNADEIKKVFFDKWLEDNPIAPTKVNLGRFELRRSGPDGMVKWELDLRKAEITLTEGAEQTTVFMSRRCGALIIHGAAARHGSMDFIAFEDLCREYRKLNLPATRVEHHENGFTVVQTLTGRVFVISALRHADFLSVTVAGGDSEAAAWKQLRQREEDLKKNGVEKLRRAHRTEWRKFWQKSNVSVPDEFAQRSWYFGLYLLNSSVASGCCPPGLLGIWAPDGELAGWRGEYAADMNTQQMFTMAAVSNHSDLLDNYLDDWIDNYEKAEAFTRKFFGGKGIFCLTGLLPDMIQLYAWPTVQFSWQASGFIGLMFYHRWKITNDVAWLQEKGYKFISGVFEFYESHLEMGNDGCYHVPLSASPEYDNDYITAWASDPNIDLALIRKICDFVIEMEQALGMNRHTARAVEIRSQLVPYAFMEYSNRNYEFYLKKVLALWPGKLMEEPHRHASHLMAIYPALDITLEDGEEACAIMEDSYKHYLSVGQYFWCGHSYGQMISFAAVLRKPSHALSFLRKASCWLSPNGMHYNRDRSNCGDWHYTDANAPTPMILSTMDLQGGVVEGINTMLLQSHRGLIRIFPAVPEAWRTRVDFRDLGAEGGLLVSAAMRDGQTTEVTIKGAPASTVKLINPFGGGDFRSNVALEREGGYLTGAIPPDGQLHIEPLR